MADLANPAPAAPTLFEDLTPNQVTLPMNPPDPALQQEKTPEQPPPETKEIQEPAEQPKEKPEEEPDEKKEIPEAPGIDYSAIEDEFMQNGSISEETQQKAVEAYTKLGIPEDQVRKVFRNMNAEVELLQLKAQTRVGGEENFKEMCEWAQNSLPEKQREVLFKLFDTDDPGKAMEAVDFMYNQFTQASMTGGNRIKASSGPVSEKPLFRNLAELAAAQKAPGFAQSPTMQMELQERLAQSIRAGVFQD